MGNLFDNVIKEDSYSPVENVVIKYLNWQNQRNIPQELEEMKNDPNTVLGLTNPVGGLSNVKAFLKRSGEKAKSAAWISSSGKEYLMNKGQIHEEFAQELQKFFNSYEVTDLDLYSKGWIRKAYPGGYSVFNLDKKTVNLIQKNVAEDKRIGSVLYIDIIGKKTVTADVDKFIKYGNKVLKDHPFFK